MCVFVVRGQNQEPLFIFSLLICASCVLLFDYCMDNKKQTSRLLSMLCMQYPAGSLQIKDAGIVSYLMVSEVLPSVWPASLKIT